MYRGVEVQEPRAQVRCSRKKRPATERKKGLFSPEAAICPGVCPALNRCVCFYGLSGPECAPQPLNVEGEPKIP